MQAFHPYVAGVFTDTHDQIIVHNKFSNKPIAKVGLASPEMIEQSISAANAIENELKNLSSGKTSDILFEIANKLFENREHFAKIIAQEAGKPLKYARIEAERASQTFRAAAEETKRKYSEIIQLDWFPYGEKKEAIVKMFPVGTIAGITPFNFPLNLVAHKVAPAIAAGCPIILKPASATPLCALELAKIIDCSDLPKGAFSVLPMNHGYAKLLLEDKRIKKISFTGSPEVGWNLKNNCGTKKITLELGGNAAAIVTESADLNEAVAKCVTGAFAFSGQVCIHTQRIFVHSSHFQHFLELFLERAGKWIVGDPLDENTDISVMIDEPNAIRVENMIHEAVRQGATLVFGGKREGKYLNPTVLTHTQSTMRVWKEEIFGPVVLIEPYEDFSQAIEMVNNSVYGLQAGVFTKIISEMNTAFQNIEAGGVLINETPTFRVDHMPYGGIKQSGFGREGIKYAIQEMSEMKVLVKPF